MLQDDCIAAGSKQVTEQRDAPAPRVVTSRNQLLKLVALLPLRGNYRALLLEMARRARMPTTSDPFCWGTHEKWGGKLHISARTVGRVVRDLQKRRLVVVRHRSKSGGGRIDTLYYLQAARIREMANEETQKQSKWKPISEEDLQKLRAQNSHKKDYFLAFLLWKRVLTAHGVSDGSDDWQNLRPVVYRASHEFSLDLHRLLLNEAGRRGHLGQWGAVLSHTKREALTYIHGN